jgi:hypothetical protein
MHSEFKSYPAPWEGRLILACRKCQKKLKGDMNLHSLAKLRRAIKERNRRHPELQLHILNTPCMDLCPKSGVTICDPREFPGRLFILRSENDIDELYFRALHENQKKL